MTTPSSEIDLDAAFKAAAEASDPVTNDFSDQGGACNFDTAIIRPEKGERLTKYQKAAGKYGMHLQSSNWLGSRAIFVYPAKIAGQGNAQTKQAEAIANALKAHGLTAMVYYQMD